MLIALFGAAVLGFVGGVLLCGRNERSLKKDIVDGLIQKGIAKDEYIATLKAIREEL